MKKNFIKLVIIISINSYYGYSQSNKKAVLEKKNVIYYQVEEIVNMKFGGTTTSYTVSDLSLISDVDLGPNNQRIITPIYETENSYAKRISGLDEKQVISSITTEKPNQNIKNSSSKVTKGKIITEEELLALRAKNRANTLKTNESDSNVSSILNGKVAHRDGIKKSEETTIKNTKRKEEINPIKTSINNNIKVTALNENKKTENPINNNRPIASINLEAKPKATIETTFDFSTKKESIIEDPEAEKASLAKAIAELRKTEASETTKTGPNREKLDYAYINIINTYEKVAEKGYKSIGMFKKMSDSFYFSKQFEKAAKWYNELFKMTTNLDPVYYFRFAHTLNKTGQTEKGNIVMTKYTQLSEAEPIK